MKKFAHTVFELYRVHGVPDNLQTEYTKSGEYFLVTLQVRLHPSLPYGNSRIAFLRQGD